MKFIQDMLDLLRWYDSVPAKDKKPKANESTMETRNEEPVEPITIVPVSPEHNDTYKYKFGGLEYQDEFDVNTYNFGARNYCMSRYFPRIRMSMF